MRLHHLVGLLAALALAVSAAAGQSQQGSRIQARVDPRVEFMSAVARTAGFDEYRMANAKSPYSDRVDALLAPYAAHPALERMRAMRRTRGLSYDAVMSLALHVGDPPGLAERMDFSRRPPRLDARLDTAETRALLKDLRDLATKARWADFMTAEAPLHHVAASRLMDAASTTPITPWFDRELGVRQGASYLLVPGLLNGGQNYGVGVQFLDGSPEEIRPVIGIWKWDSEGKPTFDGSIVPLVVHELCHTYTNPLVDRHESALKPAGEKLFASSARQMERQAYGTWKTVMYETLVRAMVVRYMRDTFGAEAGARQADLEARKGFTWVPALAAALDAYAADRTKYPTIDDFMPQVVATLQAEAARLKAGPPPPTLLASSPADGAADVPAGSGTLRLEFDRPMRTDSHSLTGDPRNLPADLAYERTENDGRVWVFRMQLQPGREYVIGLNGAGYTGFRGVTGVPLPFTQIRFRTKPL